IMLAVLCFAGLLVLTLFLWSRRKFYKLILQIPGPLGLPLFGSVPEYFINKLKKMSTSRTQYMDKYGSTVLAWIGIQPIIVSRDPKIAEDILTSPQCINRISRFAKAMENIYGQGLMTLQDTAWANRRKHMNPSFSQNVLLSFLPIFNSETKTLLTQMDTFVGDTDFLPFLYRWSFSVSHQTVLGADVNDEANCKNNTLNEPWNSISFFILLKVFMPFLRNKRISTFFGVEHKTTQLFSKIDVFMNKIIESKLSFHSESSMDLSSNIVINRVMELYRKGEITLEQVKGESCNMVLAAFETTALTVNHTLILLAMFPQYQELVFEELREVFPDGGDFEVEYEDVQKLVYLDRVLNETLRLFPGIPISTREAKEDFCLSNGVLVPKGVILGIDTFNLHRNKVIWGHNADTFDPDRFLAENVRQRHPYAFIPYLKGSRYCIGWRYAQISLKIALAKIVRNYKLSTSFRYEDLVFIDNIVIKLDKSPLLNFKKR
ncbi:hypothetical protein KR074_001674, partial [Drosophila pseudoananassae]